MYTWYKFGHMSAEYDCHVWLLMTLYKMLPYSSQVFHFTAPTFDSFILPLIQSLMSFSFSWTGFRWSNRWLADEYIYAKYSVSMIFIFTGSFSWIRQGKIWPGDISLYFRFSAHSLERGEVDISTIRWFLAFIMGKYKTFFFNYKKEIPIEHKIQKCYRFLKNVSSSWQNSFKTYCKVSIKAS